MRIRYFEHVCLSASLAIALLNPVSSWASEREIPATPESEIAHPSVSGTSSRSYGKVQIAPLTIGYTRGFLSNAKLREFQIAGADLERIRRYYLEIITDELATAYPIASEPGPAVVLVDAVLIDLVLDKRDWLLPTRLVFGGAPRFRLVAYLRDSQTGEVVGRVGFDLKPHANRLMKESPGFYWHFMRQVFDRIATRVRWALEDGPEVPS